MPGICLSRWQAGSEEAICSTSSFIGPICCSRSFHSLHSRLTRLRMRAERFTQKQLITFTAKLQTSLIVMEACSGSHFRARALREVDRYATPAYTDYRLGDG